jgi:hypothetical protein
MTLNLTEAGAVNTVIEHLTGAFPGNVPPCRPLPDRAQAILAFASLADAAYRRLSAGYSGEKALEALEAHWPGALREIWMLELHGVDGEPFATEQAARRHAATRGGWAPNDDLAWRPGLADSDTGRTAKVLYANGHRTLCTIWSTPLRGLDQAADGADAVDAPDESVATCKVCGCTEDDPCDGGCAWITGNSLEIDLCTACAFAIARDAIATGLYPLEATVGDTLFEARGGLIPQPMLTEQEIASLQPLMDAVEAANGDPEKLAEIEREYAVQVRPAAAPSGDAHERYAKAFAEDLLRSIRAGAYTSVFGLEWSFRSGGLSGPVMSETEARKHVTDLRRLYEDYDDADPTEYAAQVRLVGPWVDDPESPQADDQQEPELGSRSATDNEAFSGADQPLGERDTA